MNMPLHTPAIPDHYPAIVEAGDSGLMVLFGDTLEMSVNNAVHAFDAMFRSVSLAGVEEITPGIRGLMIRYDPLSISADALRDAINEKLTERNWLESPANPERNSGRSRPITAMNPALTWMRWLHPSNSPVTKSSGSIAKPRCGY